MARGLCSAVCFLLALAGAHATTTIVGRFFGPVVGTTCKIGHGTPQATAASNATAQGQQDTASSFSAVLAAGDFVATDPSTCMDSITNAVLPFSLYGSATAGNPAVVPIDVATGIGSWATDTSNKTAQTSYSQLGITTNDVPSADWTAGPAWETTSPFTAMMTASKYPITTAKKLLLKDLQFLIVAKGVINAISGLKNPSALPSNCVPTDVYNLVTQKTTSLPDMTDSTAITNLIKAVVVTMGGISGSCNISSADAANAATTTNVAAITLETTLAESLATTDNTWPLHDLGTMARLSGYAASQSTLPTALTAQQDLIKDVQKQTNIVDTPASRLQLLAALGISTTGILGENTNTQVKALAAGPVTSGGVTLQFQSFFDLATGPQKAPGAAQKSTTLGLWTIPQNSPDDFLGANTLVPITGIVPFPTTAGSTDTDIMYITPVNAYVFAMHRYNQGDGKAISLVKAADFTSAYTAITGSSSLPSGDYLRRTGFAGITTFPGSYLHMTLYASDILLSNTVSLGATFIFNAFNTTATNNSLETHVRNIFLAMAGVSGTLSTSLSTATSVQTMLAAAFKAQKGSEINVDEAAALLSVSTAIANANFWVKDILDNKAIPGVNTSPNGADASKVPAAEHWLQLARIASAVNSLGNAVQVAGAAWFAAKTTNERAVIRQSLLDNVQYAFTGVNLLNAISRASVSTIAIQNAIDTTVMGTVTEGVARFFGPVNAACTATYGSSSTSITYLGHINAINASSPSTAVKISLGSGANTCKDLVTGLDVPYPISGWTSGTTGTSYQVTSTTTAVTAAINPGQVYTNLGVSSSVASGFDLWADLIAGTSIQNDKQVMLADVQFIALSLGVAKAFLAGTSLPPACDTLPELQSQVATFVAAGAVGNLITNPTTGAIPAGITAAINAVGSACAIKDLTTAQSFSYNIANLTTMASTLASITTNKWPLNDIAGLAHLVAYMSPSTFSLSSNDLASQSNLMTAISATQIMPDALAAALGLPSQGRDTKVSVCSTGPLTGVQLTYQPFHMLKGTPVMDSSSKALTTDVYGAVTNPSATHGLYTVPAGSVDMVLSTGPTDQVMNHVPYTSMVGFPHSPGLTTVDTVYISPASAVAYEAFKVTQATALGSPPTPLPIKTAVDYRSVYSNFVGATPLPAGDYVARSLIDESNDKVFQGSYTALAMFSSDIMISNFVTLAGLWINNVLPATAANAATNKLDLIAQNLIAQVSQLGTATTWGAQLADSTSINTMIKAVLTTANAATPFSLPQPSDVSDAVSMIANTIANVNTEVKTQLGVATVAVDLTAKSKAVNWIRAAQVAKLVNTKLQQAVVDAAQNYKAGASGASNTNVNAQNLVNVQTTYTVGTNLTNNLDIQVLNLTALALVTGPMQGYARFYGPVSAGCNVNFTDTKLPQIQWTRKADSSYPGQVIGIEFEKTTVGWTDKTSSYPCTDTITGQVIPYPIAGIPQTYSGIGGSFFQLSSSATVATYTIGTNANTVQSAYTQLGVATTAASGGVDANDWTTSATSKGMWETSDLWGNFKAGNLRVSKVLLGTDLQFMALSLAASKVILATGQATATGGCNTTASVQDALAKFAAGTTLSMTTYNGIVAALNGIKTSCGGAWNSTLTDINAVTAPANINGILSLTQLAAKLASTTYSSNSWHLKDAAAMAHFASYLQTANLSPASISNSTLRTTVGQASIVPAVLASTLGVTYTAQDAFVQAAGLGPVGSGVTLTYQPFHWLDAAPLSVQTDDMGSVTVADATHGTYTIPAGSVDTFLTNDPAKPVQTLVDITAITGWTPSSHRIIVNPAAAFVYAYYRTQVAAEGKTVSVPSAAHWQAVYNQLTGTTLPPMDYQSRADESYVGSYASLCVLASDVILQSVPVLGGVFISASASTSNDTSVVVPLLFDEIALTSASDLSNTSAVANAISTVYTKVIAAPSSSVTGIINSVAASIAASNAQAYAILSQAVRNLTITNPGVQVLGNWVQLAQIAKVQNTLMAPAIKTVGQSILAAGSSSNTTTQLASVQTSADANVNFAFNATTLPGLIALQSVNTPALIQAAGLGRLGVARFFGPVSAGCPVTYRTSKTSGTTLLDAVPATISEQLTISTDPACMDTFTGMPIPYAAIGYAVDQFQVSATTSIGAQHGVTPKTAEFSYDQLGTTVNISAPLWTRDIKLESADIFADVFASGHIGLAKTLLTADLQFMALSAGVIQAVLGADRTPSGLVKGCQSSSDLQAALAAYVASLADGSNPAALSIQTTADVSVVLDGVGSQCNATAAAIPASILVAAKQSSSAILSLVQVSATLTSEDPAHDWPLWQLGAMSHFVSYISGSFKLSDAAFQSINALKTAIASTSVNGAGITAALNIAGFNAADTPVIMAYAGPCKNVNVTYLGFTDLQQRALADGSDFLVHVSAATHGVYILAGNATMIFLTTDDANPMKTRLPITAVTSFAPGSGNLTVGPVGGVVYMGWEQGEGVNVSVPMPLQFKQTYEMLTGFSLPANDYHARNFTLGSATALAIFVVDMWLPGAPTLAGILLNAVCPKNTLSVTSGRLYAGYQGVSMSSIASNATAVTYITAAMNDLCGQSAAVNATARRLMATDPRLITIITAVAGIIGDTSSMANELLTTAETAIANNSAVASDLFYKAAQIAAVQNGPAADAVQNIANLVAAGQLDAAVTAAQAAQTAFTGANLRAAVAAAQVNTAAIDASQTPPVDTSSNSNKALAIGLGVGLGVGIPVVGLAIAAVVMSVRKRRAMQSTTPAPPA